MDRPPVESPEVLVIGAGPVGMLAALALAERGVAVRIVDRYRRAALHSYALALHPGTVRLLEEYGLAERLVDHGQRVTRIDLRTGDGQGTTIDLAALDGPFPYVLVLEQSLLESALEERLADAGVPVLWGHSLLSLEQDDGGVTAVIALPSDEGESDHGTDDPPPVLRSARASASWAIGADGYGSLTRRLLAVGLAEVGPPLSYGLLEFDAPVADPGCMTIVVGADWCDVLWPLGASRARWGLQLPDAAPAAGAPLDLWGLVRTRSGWFDPAECRAEWTTSVGFQPRVAQSFGQGRVWLAGDAAHSTSPVGVQSMNVGLREAHDLGRRLAAILRGKREAKLLRYYHEDREREWKMLLGVHERLRVLPGAADWVRPLAPRLVPLLPGSGHDLNVMLGQLGLRLNWLRGRARRGL